MSHARTASPDLRDTSGGTVGMPDCTSAVAGGTGRHYTEADMRDAVTQFVMTENHLILLRAMNVGWCGDEYGAPEIDPKRPYGNSDVEEDIAKLIGIRMENPDHPLTDDQRYALRELHAQTDTALQVVLATGTFEAGTYECDRFCRNWRKP